MVDHRGASETPGHRRENLRRTPRRVESREAPAPGQARDRISALEAGA